MTTDDSRRLPERDADSPEFPPDIGSYRAESGELIIFDEYQRTAWISSTDSVRLEDAT